MLGRWLPALSLFVAMLLWATSFIALKIAFAHYDPMWVIFGRMLVASLCFLLFIKQICRFSYQAGDIRWLAVMVVSEPCLYFLFEAHALQNTSAAQAGMITALAPLLVGIGAYYVLKERLSVQAWAGFSIAVVGAVWLSLGGEANDSAPNPVLGNFLEFCAMLCATGYTLALKHLSARYSTWFLTALQAFAGSIFFAPFLLLPSITPPVSIEWNGLVAILYLGTLINIGAYGLYNLGVSKIKAAKASAYINLIPVFTLLLAYLILDERFNSEQLLASGLVIGGVLLSQWQPRRQQVETVEQVV